MAAPTKIKIFESEKLPRQLQPAFPAGTFYR